MLETLKHRRALAFNATKQRDISTLRRLIEDGATFASLTIGVRIEIAEGEFVRWIKLGRPDDMSKVSKILPKARNKRLASVRALTDDDIWQLAILPSREREEYFAERAWGYGPAKASFALAAAGIGWEACLDRHLIRKYSELLEANAINPERLVKHPTFSEYWRAVDLIYGNGQNDIAARQWEDWFGVIERQGRHTTHAVLMNVA